MTKEQEEADDLRRQFDKIPVASTDIGPTPDPVRVLEDIKEGEQPFKEILNKINPVKE